MTAADPLARLLPVTLLALAGAAGAQEVHRSALHAFTATPVAEGLEVPWSISWLPGGDMLVTERAGRLRVVRDGVLLPEPVEGVPAVHHKGQGGLFDALPHPDFASNRLLYLAFAEPLPDGSTTSVARGVLRDGRLAEVETVFRASTAGRDGHYGGRMAFDGAGRLFLTIGDRQASPSGDLAAHPAQDLSNHSGAVLRLLDDGRAAPGNPFAGERGALPEIWSYGHRNPQSLAFHPLTGELWSAEHGPQGGDELNRIEAGGNYGWPVVGYGVNYGPGRPIHAAQTRRGMEPPRHYWTPSIAASGLMIYDGAMFPGWRGDAFVGGMRGRRLARVELAEDGRAVQEETLLAGVGRVRDVRQGPDGAVYLATENRGVLRLARAD